MQQKLESKDEDTLEVRETYTTLQQEVEIKTKKLKKVRTVTTTKYKANIWDQDAEGMLHDESHSF